MTYSTYIVNQNMIKVKSRKIRAPCKRIMVYIGQPTEAPSRPHTRPLNCATIRARPLRAGATWQAGPTHRQYHFLISSLGGSLLHPFPPSLLSLPLTSFLFQGDGSPGQPTVDGVGRYCDASLFPPPSLHSSRV